MLSASVYHVFFSWNFVVSLCILHALAMDIVSSNVVPVKVFVGATNWFKKDV